jgi:hypothetical protein
MDDHDKRRIIANPYYAITISPDLIGEHQPLQATEDWVKANAQLASELGFEAWAHLLLSVLQGDFVAAPDEPVQ